MHLNKTNHLRKAFSRKSKKSFHLDMSKYCCGNDNETFQRLSKFSVMKISADLREFTHS